jgi:hypothetical protein
MFEPRIKVPRRLHNDLARLAKARGYSSVGEFALHVLEKTVETSKPVEAAAIKERLRGLGYLE